MVQLRSEGRGRWELGELIVLESGLRSRVGGVIVVAALATAGIVFFGVGSSTNAPNPPAASASPVASGAALVTVHVSGEVTDPGLVGVATGSRVADAIAAAGGTSPRADLSAINLAAPVRDGDQIVVPAFTGPGTATAAGVGSDTRVRINRATAADLETLPGVGPVLAERIVEYRETHGPFAEVEDLLDVAGIGGAKLASMREAIALP